MIFLLCRIYLITTHLLRLPHLECSMDTRHRSCYACIASRSNIRRVHFIVVVLHRHHPQRLATGDTFTGMVVMVVMVVSGATMCECGLCAMWQYTVHNLCGQWH